MKMVSISYEELKKDLNEEERKELDALSDRAIIFDKECPEMTPEQLEQFKRVRKVSRTKQTASIRLSEKAQKFSAAYGKGYTSFLSRLIDAALDDEALVRKCV